jgi:hypothetical protein
LLSGFQAKAANQTGNCKGCANCPKPEQRMSKQNLLPRSNAAKKAVRAIMRKVSAEPDSPDILRLNELYEAASDRATRRLLRAVQMQILTAEPPKPAKFVPKKLPKPEPIVEEVIEEPEVVEVAPPPPSKPKKSSSMMSLDLSDATMLLQFGGGDDGADKDETDQDDIDAPDEVMLAGDFEAPTDEQVLDEVVPALDDEDSPSPEASDFNSLGPAPSMEFSPSDLAFPDDDAIGEETSDQSMDDWDPFAEDEEAATDETDGSDLDTDEVQIETEDPKPAKAKKGVPTTDLSALSGGSALFDQLSGSFGDDMND